MRGWTFCVSDYLLLKVMTSDKKVVSDDEFIDAK